MPNIKVIAVGVHTQNDVNQLGDTLARIWPLQDAGGFDELLSAIDDADQASPKFNDLHRSRR